MNQYLFYTFGSHRYRFQTTLEFAYEKKIFELVKFFIEEVGWKLKTNEFFDRLYFQAGFPDMTDANEYLCNQQQLQGRQEKAFGPFSELLTAARKKPAYLDCTITMHEDAE